MERLRSVTPSLGCSKDCSRREIAIICSKLLQFCCVYEVQLAAAAGCIIMSSALNLSLPRRIFPRHWHSLGRRAEALSCSNLTVDLRSVGRMHFPSNLHLLLSQITLTSSGESAWNQAKSAMPFLGRVDCCVGRFRSDGLRLSPDVRFILIAT